MKVWNFFANEGFSAASIAGIMGNIKVESNFVVNCLQTPVAHAARSISMGKLHK